MRVLHLNTNEQFAAVRDEWDRLAQGVPFRGHAWLHGWWEHYGASHELVVLQVQNTAGRTVAFAPWYLENSACAGRTLKALGSGEVCTDYVSLLCAEGREPEVARALADYLCDEHNLDWDLLQFDGIDPDDRAAHVLASALAEREQLVHTRDSFRCWRVELPGTWEEYVALQSKSHRKQLRRFQTRVLESGRGVLHFARTEQDLDRGWEILVDLHQQRRKSLGQSGCFASDKFAAFHRQVSRRLLALGQLRLAHLELDGAPAAVEYQLVGGGVTYAYQSGIDPSRIDEEPGRVIMIATIAQAIETGMRGFDFLRGDEPYKAHWRAQPRQMRQVRIVRNRTTARLRHQVWLAAGGVKNWLKGSLDLVTGGNP